MITPMEQEGLTIQSQGRGEKWESPAQASRKEEHRRLCSGPAAEEKMNQVPVPHLSTGLDRAVPPIPLSWL
jgi:hypothetical protein